MASGCGHYQRSNYGEIQFRPAADGWHPETSARPGRPVLVDVGALFPGGPLTSWPAALTGEVFTPPRGRGIPRYLSDEKTGRRPGCNRAQVRRADGRLIAHKGNGDRCTGSGEFPGEDLALASWLPVSKGLTPHGLRHGHRVWMDEDKIPLVLQADRLGHEPGMRGVYGHVSDSMRDQIKQGRYVMRDGYHRAFGLLSRGITRVPAYVRNFDTTENLAPVGTLPQAAWLGDRPPLLRDYHDDHVAESVSLPAQHRMIVIHALELLALN